MIRLKSEIKRIWARLRPDFLPHAVALMVGAVSVLLILMGMLKPFYALPELDAAGALGGRDSFLTRYFKLALVVVVFLLALGLPVLAVKGKKAGHLLTRATFLMFLLCLTYPTFLVIYDPVSTGDGAWLQQQHDTMTWLGGDIYRAHSERSIESGMGVNAQDPPLRLAVFKPPTGSLGIERLNDWIWWAGYGPSWTQFAGKGWFYMCFGFLFLTLALLGSHWRWSIPDARVLLKKLFLQGGMVVVAYSVVVGSVYTLCRAELRASEAATAEGDYPRAYEKLNSAVRVVPGLINDTGIILQRGYFQWRLGEKEAAECHLYAVQSLEEQGYHDRARATLNALWEEEQMPRHASRELARHQLRVAINDINSGKASSAQGHLQRLLTREPNCVQAHFHMQLVNLQSDDLMAVRVANEKIVTLYKGFKSKDKRGVIATSYWLLAQAEAKNGNTVESWVSRKISKGQK